MFWRFGGYANISSLDNILDKPDVTLEDLLDESDLIQELKQQNSKLIEFLREELILAKLLDYALLDPKPPEDAKPKDEDMETDARSPRSPARSDKSKRKDADKHASKMSFFARSRSRSKSAPKRDYDAEKVEHQRRKFAYVATEVLSSEVWSLTEALFESQDQLRKFWEYLRRPAPLDPIQAGYFTKINDMLLDKKTEEMFAFLKTLDGVVPEMLKHVDSPMVMDLLLKMISLEKSEGGQGIVDWLQREGLIPILLSYLGPGNPLPTQTAAGDFLKAIITISANATGQDQTVIGPNELTRQLVSEKCVTRLIDDMLHGGNPLTVGVGIVIEVIRKNNSDYDIDGQVVPEPRTTDPIYLGTLLRAFAKALPEFMALVCSSEADRPSIKVAFGERIQPLGFDRFKTCELMAELLHCSNMGLLNERGADAEFQSRDSERERLKANGSLGPVPATDTSADEVFASSVDSHGFHHARAPNDDVAASPERFTRLEVQNASDEDGFEKVAVSDADPLPDEVTFDELSEKLDDVSLPAAAPLKPAKSSERAKTSNEDGGEVLDANDGPKEKRRVSLLTQQIQDHIDETVSEGPKAPLSPEEQRATTLQPGDKPAPLFAGKSSPSQGVDPILGSESPKEDAEPGSHSIATLQPASRDEHELSDLPYESEADGSPVIGDYLKMQFVKHEVVPTILDFFFRFPWNNFLHNVVYDIVQQVFNGTLDRGYNRVLAQALFLPSVNKVLLSNHEITQRILDGQAASEKSVKEKGMRLGYMGHLTLISEEVCKFAERHTSDVLGDTVMDKVTTEAWVTYVEGILSDTRDRDNAVLGGVRPEHGIGIRSLGGGSLMSQGYGSAGHSSALASAGLMAPSDSLALHDEIGEYDDGRADLDGIGDGGEDEELEDDSRGRASAIDDDEQISAAIGEATSDTIAASSSAPHAPPPLNIPPSRARRQLAVRLAQRRREAEKAANKETFQRGRSSSSSDQSSPSSEDEVDLLAHGTVGLEDLDSDEDVDEEIDLGEHARSDPDTEDSVALAVTDKLASAEPLGNDSAASATKVGASTTTGAAAAPSRPSKPMLGRAVASGSAVLPRLSSFTHADLVSSNLSDEDDDDDDDDADSPVAIPVRRRPSSGVGEAFPRLGGSTSASSSTSPSKYRTESKEERKNSRPSTTEAKVRRPIDNSDDEDEELGDRGGDTDEGDDIAGGAGASSGPSKKQPQQQQHSVTGGDDSDDDAGGAGHGSSSKRQAASNFVIGNARQQSAARQQQSRAAHTALMQQQQAWKAGSSSGGGGGNGSSGDDDEGGERDEDGDGEGDSEDDVIEIRPRRSGG